MVIVPLSKYRYMIGELEQVEYEYDGRIIVVDQIRLTGKKLTLEEILDEIE